MTLANAGENRDIPIIALCRLNSLAGRRSNLSMKVSGNVSPEFAMRFHEVGIAA